MLTVGTHSLSIAVKQCEQLTSLNECCGLEAVKLSIVVSDCPATNFAVVSMDAEACKVRISEPSLTMQLRFLKYNDAPAAIAVPEWVTAAFVQEHFSVKLLTETTDADGVVTDEISPLVANFTVTATRTVACFIDMQQLRAAGPRSVRLNVGLDDTGFDVLQLTKHDSRPVSFELLPGVPVGVTNRLTGANTDADDPKQTTKLRSRFAARFRLRDEYGNATALMREDTAEFTLAPFVRPENDTEYGDVHGSFVHEHPAHGYQ